MERSAYAEAASFQNNSVSRKASRRGGSSAASEASELPEGLTRNHVMRKARQCETGPHMIDRVDSRGFSHRIRRKEMKLKRKRVKQTDSLEIRLQQFATDMRHKAEIPAVEINFKPSREKAARTVQNWTLRQAASVYRHAIRFGFASAPDQGGFGRSQLSRSRPPP